jgi:hypothetical protein
MRKVVLKLTTQKDLIEHQSNASTFGELKKEMRQVKWSGMRVVERSTKTTLQMDDAVLPQGEFVLFLVPEKVKSGKKTSGGTEELSKPIEECSYNECRSHMSWLNRNKDANLDMSGGTASLQMQLSKYYKKNPAGTSATKKVAPKAAPKAEAKKPEAAKKPAAKAPKAEPVKEEVKETKRERKAREKAEKKAAKVKANAPVPTDPIEIIEASREKINKAVDQIVLDMIENGGTVPAVLQFTADDLEKEIKKIHNALRTSRSSAKYID